MKKIKNNLFLVFVVQKKILSNFPAFSFYFLFFFLSFSPTFFQKNLFLISMLVFNCLLSAKISHAFFIPNFFTKEA